MKTLTDLDGKTWEFRFDLLAYRRIRTNLIPDFLDNEKTATQHLARLGKDRYLLSEAFRLVVLDEIKARGLTEDDFFHLWGGGIMEEVYEALAEGIVDFFPHLQATVIRVLEELKMARAEVTQIVNEEMAKIPRGKLLMKHSAGLRKMLSDSLAESEESIPTDTP